MTEDRIAELQQALYVLNLAYYGSPEDHLAFLERLRDSIEDELALLTGVPARPPGAQAQEEAR